MSNYDAIGMTLGLMQVDTHEQDLKAWQTLVDTGLVWKLSAEYIRVAKTLIEGGFIKETAQ